MYRAGVNNTLWNPRHGIAHLGKLLDLAVLPLFCNGRDCQASSLTMPSNWCYTLINCSLVEFDSNGKLQCMSCARTAGAKRVLTMRCRCWERMITEVGLAPSRSKTVPQKELIFWAHNYLVPTCLTTRFTVGVPSLLPPPPAEGSHRQCNGYQSREVGPGLLQDNPSAPCSPVSICRSPTLTCLY